MKMYPSSPCWLRSRPWISSCSRDPQTHHRIEDLQDNEGGHRGQDPGDHDRGDLSHDQLSHLRAGPTACPWRSTTSPRAYPWAGCPATRSRRYTGWRTRRSGSPPASRRRRARRRRPASRRSRTCDFSAGAGQEADDAHGHAHHQGRHRRDEAGGRRDADQPRHHARAGPQERRLAADDPLDAGPGQARRRPPRSASRRTRWPPGRWHPGALPALKPNQPTQSIVAPMAV